MAVMGGGKTQVIANTASIANGDNIVSYLADAAGTLLTSTSGKLDVYPASTYAEDAAHASGDLGQLILAVRNDAGTALAGTDGDYIALSTDSVGRLYTVSTIPTGQNFTKVEDAASANADILAAIAVVRKDAAGTLVSADGDYAAVQQNAIGELRVIQKSEIAVLQQVVVVGTTAVALPTTSLSNRKSLMIQMLSNGNLYVGSATVTATGATRGIKIGNGGYVTFDVGPAPILYGIADQASRDVVTLEMS